MKRHNKKTATPKIKFNKALRALSENQWGYRKPRKPNQANEKRKRSYNPDQLSLF